MKRFCWILIMVLSVFEVEAFSKTWNGITPGVSTRLEVKKILGKGDPWQARLARYRFKKLTIYVDYYKEEGDYSDKDIVVRIDVSPDNRGQPLARYIKKIPNFHKNFVKKEIPDEISHVHGEAHYNNDAEGFEITVIRGLETEQEFIIGFSYYAPNFSKSQKTNLSLTNKL